MILPESVRGARGVRRGPRWPIVAGFGLSAIAVGLAPRLAAQSAQQWLAKDLMGRRAYVRLVGDDRRGRLVHHGSLSGNADTWEWDGQSWTRRRLAVNAPSLFRGSAVHDTVRDRTVLFGGQFSDETWEYDGTVWERRSPATKPPQASYSWDWRLAFDEARGRTVAFGGGVVGVPQTWEYDGVDWQQESPAVSPAFELAGALGFDPAAGRVMWTTGDTTWHWGGTDWIDVTPAVGPPPLVGPALAPDRRRGVAVLFGGGPSDTWEWDGASWTQRPTATTPTVGTFSGMAWWAAGQVVVLFGGGHEVWTYDGIDWRRTTHPRELTVSATAFAADPLRGQIVAPDGMGGTWLWDGVSWWLEPMAGPYQIDGGFRLAYDSARGVVVAGGSYNYGAEDAVAATWEWDGTTWRRRAVDREPSPRFDYALAYDEGLARTVMFGGTTYPGWSDETWEWDGARWELVAGSGPSGRENAAMAYDVARGQLVLYGGQTSSTSTSNETWLRTGQVWTQVFPAQDPGPQLGHVMVYDPVRARVVLLCASAGCSVAWEWDGVNWAPAAALGSAPRAQAAAYDVARSELVAYGVVPGQPSNTPETVVLVDTVAAAAVTYGTGCAGSGAIARLGGFGLPRLGNPSFALDVDGAPPVAPLAILLSPAAASLPVAGCTVLVDLAAAVALPAAVSPLGFATLALPIPEEPALLGGGVFVQTVVVDALAARGFATTPGLALTVGR